MTARQRHRLGLAATLAAGLGATLSAAWAASAAGCLGPGPTSASSKVHSDPAVPVRARVGDPVRVSLKENPTTGYEWQRSPGGGAVVRFVEKTYEPDRPVLIGSGGRAVFRYAAVAPGEAALRFALFPPGDTVAVDSVRFTVVVESPDVG